MFNIEVLPAADGDCLWIEYGKRSSPSRILIDCGRRRTFPALRARIEKLPVGERRFELLVISHYDNDHIEGAVKLLNAPGLKIGFDDIWFNGWQQLLPGSLDTLGAAEGEFVTALVEKAGLPLNRAFEGNAIAIPTLGALPVKILPGGMQLTILSPTPELLIKLSQKWKEGLLGKELAPGDSDLALKALAKKKGYSDLLGEEGPDIDAMALAKFDEDSTVSNGSSIAFLAEYEGKQVLFAADAHPSVIAGSLERLLDDAGMERLDLSAFKLSHHGSKNNLSVALLDLVRCQNFIFASNGDSHGHPDPEAVARVLSHGGPKPRLIFNYRSKFNSLWNARGLKTKYGYETRYPANGKQGITLAL